MFTVVQRVEFKFLDAEWKEVKELKKKLSFLMFVERGPL